MSDQQPPYRSEGQPNPPGWTGPWPPPGGSSTPQPSGPPPAGGSASPWGSTPEELPTQLAGYQQSGPQQSGPPQAGQSGGWPTPAAGGYQPGGWSGPPGEGQAGWASHSGGGAPPSWPQQPGTQPWQDNQWGQQPPGGHWPQQSPQSGGNWPPQPPQPPQQPAYQQGWPQPGGPPGGGRKKTNPAFVIAPLALVAAIVLGVVIALALRDDGGGGEQNASNPGSVLQPTTSTVPVDDTETPATRPPATSGTSAAGSPPGAPDCDPVAPVSGPPPGGPETVLDIGQTAHIVNVSDYGTSDFEVNITLNGVCTQTTAFESWSEPPVQGLFVLADVTVELISGDVSATYFDFSVQTADGGRYAGTFPPVEPRLATFDMTPGSVVRGFVLVDAPAGDHLLRWEPTFANTAGIWRY